MAKKVTQRSSNNKIIYILLLFLATIFMGIGYAALDNVLLNVDGIATVLTQDVVHISSALYSSNNGADTEHSAINGYSATVLNSTVTLGSSSSSTITYEVTIYNETNDDYIYTGTSYSAPEFYDNTNITFDVTGMNAGYKLDAKTSKTFYITFKYSGSNTSNHVLNSYISFDFDKYYTITYQNINTTNQNYPEYILDSENTKTITFVSDIPYDVSITPTVSYSYDYSTGVLTLNNVKTNIVIDRYYKITYNLNGGTNPNNQATKYLHGSSVTILDATKENKTFGGWYDNSSFTGNAITSTSGLSGDLTLYAKWNSSLNDVATQYILALVDGYSSSSTDTITLSAPTGATCTNTLAYDGTTDNNLRYIGHDPCNYVKFNCDSSGNCELWRIIGVMNGVDSAPVLKLVLSDNTKSAKWHSKNANDWESSDIYNTLNNTYLNSLNSGVINDFVLNAQWRIGALSQGNGVLPSAHYTAEKATLSSATYIGMINFTDYAYATTGGTTTSRNECITGTYSTNLSDCYNNNYLYISGQNQWTINKNSTGKFVIYITNIGIMQKQNPTSSYRYRPTVYLKSNVKINTESGDGSSGSPYELIAGN